MNSGLQSLKLWNGNEMLIIYTLINFCNSKMYVVPINKMYGFFSFSNNSLFQSAKCTSLQLAKKNDQTKNKINKMPSAHIIIVKIQVLHDPDWTPHLSTFLQSTMARIKQKCPCQFHVYIQISKKKFIKLSTSLHQSTPYSEQISLLSWHHSWVSRSCSDFS